MARKRANLTDLLNDLTFRSIYNRYKLIAVNEHVWNGLPDGIQSRHIENWLFEYGRCCFFRDPDMSHMALECSEAGQQNVYGDPLFWQVHGFNYQRRIADEKCVIIKNNLLMQATKPFVLHYVNKLTEAERTMDVNVKACKTPVIFACDDKDLLTFKNMFQQVDGNVPALFVDRGLALDSITAYQTGVKFMGNELMDYKRSVESDLLTFLGQNNTPVDKKERLITDEATANNQMIESFADLQLAARQLAADEINKMFGLNVTVKRRLPVENHVETEENVGGEPNA